MNHMNLIEKIAVSKGWHIEVKRGKLALSIKRSELQVEVLIKELATSRT